MDLNRVLQDIARQPDVYDQLYEILGCTPSSTPEQITTEYRQRVLTCHPDRHPEDPVAAREAFERLQLAYSILGSPQERAIYDRWRTSGLRLSFLNWRSLAERGHALHWQPAPTPKMMLTDRDTPSSPPPPPSDTLSESDQLIQQFRNYQL
jgi:DnaJ family protein C protein 12